MNFVNPTSNIPLTIIASALFMLAHGALAENLGELPASKHQSEALSGSAPMDSSDHRLSLSGDQEVPPVTTSASGQASITIGADKVVSGGVSTTGIEATAAHIHTGAPGQNGPVVITLVKDGDQGWLVPVDATLTDAQYAAFKAGQLYVNVHSATHGAGEIRAQLKP